MSEYDLVVIGAGPGGYVSAIRAAQLGMKVACVDKRETLGGTCLNVGCIPSKALLQSSYKYYDATKHFEEHGVIAGDVKADVAKMLERKNKVVEDLTKGIDFLFKKNNVEKITGSAELLGGGKISVDGNEISAKNILIATGSVPSSLPNLEIDEKTIVSSTGALDFDKVPEHMVIIGGGVIGLELGSVWSRLGADVTVVEFADNITPNMDADVVKQFSRSLKKQGFKIKTKTKVMAVEITKSGAVVKVEGRDNGKEDTIECDKVLVAVGRLPYTDNLGLDKAGVNVSDRGFIEVGENFKTSADNVYAIGDVIGGAMLAHKAEEEGVACVEAIAGQSAHINYNTIPSVVYTHPEVASVGKTEAEVEEAGIEYKTGQFAFMANSRGRAVGETEGFVKVITEKSSDKILGVHIVGAEAGTMIHEAVIVMEYSGTAEDLYRCCHAHPTLNEAVKEACLAVHDRAIHA
ncbi:MAG: dihydrolipoyl dehydrogenase [Alphaproteobacteria bacterium]